MTCPATVTVEPGAIEAPESIAGTTVRQRQACLPGDETIWFTADPPGESSLDVVSTRGACRRGDHRTSWCSNGFDVSYDGGDKLRVTFALDCCDREVMTRVVGTTGYRSDDVQNVMLEAVERGISQGVSAVPSCVS